jgi:hypothetical protein
MFSSFLPKYFDDLTQLLEGTGDDRGGRILRTDNHLPL